MRIWQCVDITFADPKDVAEVTPDNCSNSSDILFDYVYSTSAQSGAESILSGRWTWMSTISATLVVVWTMM